MLKVFIIVCNYNEMKVTFLLGDIIIEIYRTGQCVSKK